MIGYWNRDVCRLSVCLSVCNAVHCDVQGRCTGLKLYQRLPSMQFSYSLLQTLCCRMCRHKSHRKKQIGEKLRQFVQTQANVYSVHWTKAFYRAMLAQSAVMRQ